MSWMKIFAKRKDTRADTAQTDGKYGELQLTATGDLRVRDDDANTALAAALASSLAVERPTVNTPVAALTSTAAWLGYDIPDDAQFAFVSVTTASCYVVPRPLATSPPYDGCAFAVNGTYKIPCFGMTKLYIKWVAAEGTIGVTYFGA